MRALAYGVFQKMWLVWRFNGLKLGIEKRAHFIGQDIRHYIKGFSSAALIVH